MSNNAESVAAVDLPLSPSRASATPNQVLAIVCTGIVLANLDLFIVNVALPNISADLGGTSLDDMSWVLNGYAIAYAALLVFFGRLAERYRRNASFLLGVATFTAASAACAAATSVESLVIFRVLQAAGAALMTPTSLGLLLASFAPDRRAGAVRTWTAVGGLAAALGPVVGGVLVTASWRWIFIVNVPIGLIALAIGWWKLPEVPGHDAPRPNPWAALTVTGGVAALIFAIVKGPDWGWSSPRVGLSFVAAAVMLGLFVRHCLKASNPFVDPALFRIRRFTAAVLIIAPFSAAFGAMLLSIALWQQTGWGWSALKAGLVIAPGPLLVTVTSLLLVGRLTARFGPAPVITAGIGFLALGLTVWAMLITSEPSVLIAIAGMVPTGIGVGLTLPSLMAVATSSLPPSAFSTGSGVVNMIRQATMAVGVAVFVAVLGTPGSAQEMVAAYHRGWWVLVGIVAIALLPLLWLVRGEAAARAPSRAD